MKRQYRDVCLQMGINVDKNGKYLNSNTSDYKRIQVAARNLRRKITNRNLQSTTQKGVTKSQQVDEIHIIA